MVQMCRILLLVLSFSTFFNTLSLASEKDRQGQGTTAAKLIKKSAFHDGMRKVWEDHISWTRFYLISALAELPDKDYAAKRLLKNQEDIGNAIKPFYGNEAGDKLILLLKDHVQIAVNLVAALKENDEIKSRDAQRLWQSNANEIAAFLNKANPKHWALDDVQHMMKEHLDLTSFEVAARLKSDWAADVEAYDKVHDHILKMADFLSEGIMKQFPKKFSK